MDQFLITLLDRGAAIGIPVLAVILYLMTREINALTVAIAKSGAERDISIINGLQQTLQSQTHLAEQHRRMTDLLTQQNLLMTLLINDPKIRERMAEARGLLNGEEKSDE